MREYLLVFLVAASVTSLLTVIAREIAVRTGAVAQVRDRDVHDEPVPYLGGLAMLGGLWAAYLVAHQLPFLSGADPYIFDQAEAVLVAGSIICGVGVLDDILELDALTKFGGQLLAGGVLVWQGVQFFFVPIPGSATTLLLDLTQGSLLTVFMIVATVNAVNFVDGLDGLAAGVVGVGALAFFVYSYLATDINDLTLATTGALLSIALAGACTGFMPHNFHPARLFMGDSGSMLIGLVLAAATITYAGQFSAPEIASGGTRFILLPLLLPVLILVVPFSDLVLAVFRRTRAGRSPFSPDKQHLHHRLLEFGHSHRRAVVIMWLWAGLVGGGVVLLSLYSSPSTYVGLVVAVLLVVALTFALPRIQKPRLAHHE